MDFRAKETSWLNQMEQVYGGTSDCINTSGDQQTEELFSDIQFHLLKRTRLWWSRALLERYTSKQIIPRGLRVRVTPTFIVEDDEFIKKWEEACNLCSSTLMQLLIKYNTDHILKLDKELESEQALLKSKCTEDKFKNFEKALDAKLDSAVKKIQDTQLKKFNRDQRDFATNMVYFWRRPSSTHNSLVRSSSFSSANSTSDQSDISSMSQTRSGAHFGGGGRGAGYSRQYQTSLRPPKQHRGSNKVINLSTHQLTSADVSLLERGLSFSPVAKFDPFLATKDLHIFARSLIFKKYFFDDQLHSMFPSAQEQEAIRILEELSAESTIGVEGKIPSSIKPRSKRFPSFASCPNIELFVQIVSENFKEIATHVTSREDNLTREERSRLYELKHLSNVVLKPADKGGNIVIWPSDMYEKEAFRQLSDSACYKKLTYNPLSSFSAQLKNILKRATDDGVVTSDLASALQVNEPSVVTMYLLPKIHKNSSTPPGRPIISGCNGFLENVNKWIESILQPIVQTLPSFLKDTGDLLKRVDGMHLGDDTLLVCADVESLYTNIRHGDGLAAVRYFINMSNFTSEIVNLVMVLLEFSLTHNFFLFKGSFYLQLQGTAMGAAFAPSYANLFLGLWERDLFLSDRLSSMDRVPFWARYIDDIFLIWQGPSHLLKEFFSVINKNEYNIHLTYSFSHDRIDFLDVVLKRDASGFIQTDLFRKPTAANSFLHASSSHPAYMLNAVPVGQFLRIRRVCSTNEDFEVQATKLKTMFRERGYSNRSIKHAYHRAKYSTRDQLLYPKNKPHGDEVVRFVTQYHAQFSAMRECVSKSWSILRADPTLRKILPDRPYFGIRRAKNLYDHFVRSLYRPPLVQTIFGQSIPAVRGGCVPCGGCIACPNIVRSDSFCDSSNLKTYPIKQRITCTSCAVVYYATCPCGKIYVGLTTRQFKVRVREHVLGILASATVEDAPTLKTLPRHFKLCHNSDARGLKVRGIDMLNMDARGGAVSVRLAQLEARWIWILNTTCPSGLNENNSFSSFL
ncbi:uncharacterized protein ACNLHF_013530 isoform 1-T1 [Anomaloglossus baeobatrachus]